jgi:hypothetical protein
MDAMDHDGRHGAAPGAPHGTPVPPKPAGVPVPRPSAPPPMPAQPPPASDLEIWLRAPRRIDAPGIYGYGHTPREKPDPARLPARQLLTLALLTALLAIFMWSLLFNHVQLPYQLIVDIADAVLPHTVSHNLLFETLLGYAWYAVVVLVLVLVLGRRGHWAEVWRRYVRPVLRSLSEPAPGTEGDGSAPDPVTWPELRAYGQASLADRLTVEVRSGRMNDVDYTRVSRAWARVARDPALLDAFADSVLRDGAAACAHPSGMRDVPFRGALHDLLTRQVRIGRGTLDDRNPYQHRGSGIALDPGVLGTGLLAVGPPGSGKTRHVVRPVVEAMCLQALAGQAAVVAVGTAGADLGPAEAFDVVIALADPASRYDLDLYGGADPDTAAATLAEALLDPHDAQDGDLRQAATALGQLLGPFAAAFGRYPSVSELRELLDGTPHAYAALREALDAAGHLGLARELDARERQAGRDGDVGHRLADRVALLDRPAFAGFFDVTGRSRPFSMYALEHPLRVRIDLPARGHAAAGRMLARLVLAQFTAAVTARRDRSLFACLVLDDAAQTVSTEAVRGLARLRPANAGAVLALRSLDEVPERLRPALLGAVGCRMAMSGLTTWDGRRFAEAWGTTWVETRDVTRTPDRSGGMLRRTSRGMRRLVTGEAATTESVTVREVERERWSASDLAQQVPPGHAVLSLTTTAGESAPPVLLDLRA